MLPFVVSDQPCDPSPHWESRSVSNEVLWRAIEEIAEEQVGCRT